MCYNLWYNAPTMLPAGHRPNINIKYIAEYQTLERSLSLRITLQLLTFIHCYEYQSQIETDVKTSS